MAIEAAESRPLIVQWLTSGILFISVFLLVSSFLATWGVVKQFRKNDHFAAVKASGDFYEIHAYKNTVDAQAEARKITISRYEQNQPKVVVDNSNQSNLKAAKLGNTGIKQK